jgi:hypothetical protein
MPLIRYLSDRLFRFLMPEQNQLGDALDTLPSQQVAQFSDA